MDALQLTTQLRRNPEMIFTSMDNEIVMMSVENSEYYGLDPVAASIWNLLEQPASIEELVAKLTDEYDVDKATCEKDVLEFAVELLEKKILLPA